MWTLSSPFGSPALVAASLAMVRQSLVISALTAQWWRLFALIQATRPFLSRGAGMNSSYSVIVDLSFFCGPRGVVGGTRWRIAGTSELALTSSRVLAVSFRFVTAHDMSYGCISSCIGVHGCTA